MTTPVSNDPFVDVAALMEEDAHAQSNAVPSDEQLSGISALAEEQLRLEERLKEAEALVQDISKELRNISQVKLPEAMQALGLSAFALSDGSSITVKDEVFASIKEKDRPAAHQWLREMGFNDIIKNEVIVSFGRGDDDRASELGSILAANAYDNWKQKEAVHTGTLKAFIKEQLSLGNNIPLSLFSAFLYQRSIIKKSS